MRGGRNAREDRRFPLFLSSSALANLPFPSPSVLVPAMQAAMVAASIRAYRATGH